MTGADHPVTRTELREELERFVTKDDLRTELERFATKGDFNRLEKKLDQLIELVQGIVTGHGERFSRIEEHLGLDPRPPLKMAD